MATRDETVRRKPDSGAEAEGWLHYALERLARGDPESLEALLTPVGAPVTLSGTKASCRCHFLVRDGNDRARIDALVEKLAKQVLDYCIPRSQIAEAAEHLRRTGSAEAFSALEREARELFARVEQSGEGGELLLYLLLENALRLPQLLCKMPLKTSSQMHVHGVDGVHGRLLPGGNLALYWGEAKLYGTVNEAIDACFTSIGPYLLDSGGGPARRDLLLVRNHLDPGDEEVRRALVRYFDEDQPESAKVEFRGACLVGFGLEDYPRPWSDDGVGVRAEVAAEIARWHERIATRVGKQHIEAFELEVFCVPLPSVEEFRRKIRASLSR